MTAPLALLAILILGLRACQPARGNGLTCGGLQPWSFYGGDWSSDGAVLEDARNGRGDMVLSRNDVYRDFDYSVQMQMRDLYPGTSYGDAGVLFRVRSPHLGVDSYNGFYAGLRASDHALFLGRVDDEWRQLLYTPLPAALLPGAWYTFSVRARGCDFLVSVAPAGGGPRTKLHYAGEGCPAFGSVGMRVYYAKAAWRGLRLTEH